MKTRILSFILALVMVLSCMSMSILATDTPDAQVASEGYKPPVTQIPCKDAASILGDKLIYADDFDSGAVTATNYLSGFGISGSYLTCSSKQGSVLTSPNHKSGESYVISFDMMIDGSRQFYPFYTITSTTGGNPFYPITFDKAGTVGYYTMYEDGPKTSWLDTKIALGTFYRLDFVHHVAENTFDFYIDGVRMVAGIAASTTDNFTFEKTAIDVTAVDNFKMYYSDVNLECAHSLVENTCEWCGKEFKFNVGSHTHTVANPPKAESFECVDAADKLGEDLIFAVDFDNIALEDVSSYLTGFTGAKNDENGNGTTYYYGQGTLKSPNHKSGETYVFSFDFMHDGKQQYYPFYTVSSTTGGAGMYPMTIAPDGTFGYYVYEGSMKNRWTDIKLDAYKFYRIDFVHFVSENTYDIYIDGQRILTGLAPSNTNNFTFGETKFHVYAVDNIKMYYADTNLECAHSFSDSFTCDWCGKAFDVEFEDCDVCNGSVISEGAAVVEKSVSLGKMIDMNVYMSLSDELINSNSKVVLTCGNRTAEHAIADAVAEENGLYKFSIELRSTQMASDVEVKIVGEPSNVYTTTVKAYVEELIETSENASAVKLAKALLNYGAAAQEYFAEWNGDDTLDDLLANAGLSDADKTVVDVTGMAGFNALNYAPYVKGGDVEFTDATIMFSAQTHVKIFFTASEEATVTVGGKEVIPNAGDGRGEYYVTFTVESPKELMTAVSIVVTDGDSMVAQEFSAGLLIKIGVAAELGDSFTALLKAYAYYGMCSSEYVA